MAAALVVVCVDPRLNHEIIRLQVRQRMGRSGLRAERIYLLGDVGGNLGSGFRQTAELLTRTGEPVVLAAVLHHDDCLGAREGQRKDLADSAQEMATELSRLGLFCPVLTGQVRTAHSQVLWSDELKRGYAPFSFGAGN
jgi:hypothetical protein